jgi:hypothetical protein
MLLKLAALGALGYVGYRYYQHHNSRAAFAGGQPKHENAVRDAGPDAIRDITRREWTKEDEASDESFPASDPPSTY